MNTTRRQFGQIAALAAASVGAPAWARGLAPSEPKRFAFASVAAGTSGTLHAMHIVEDEFVPLCMIPTPAAGRLLLHPTLPVLYALHDIALWDHLPRGAVSAYHFHPDGGTLTHLGTQPLSLAATNPRDGVVFSHGSALFVRTQAGIYNVLPLRKDGGLKPVSAIRKVLDSGIGSGVTIVQLLTDGETLVVASAHEARSFRFVQNEYGAHVQQVEFDRTLLPRWTDFDEQTKTTWLKAKFCESCPGVKGIVIPKA